MHRLIGITLSRLLVTVPMFALAVAGAAMEGFSLLAGAQTPSTCVPAVPCGDRRGCPDLVVDRDLLLFEMTIERTTFLETDCSVVEGEVSAGERRLLRFTTNTPNLGPGALIIGSPNAHPEGFDLETCHGHPHFKEYSDYRLWTPRAFRRWRDLRRRNSEACARDLLAADLSLLEGMVAGHKQGFCVSDVFPSAVPCNATPDRPRFNLNCTYQGISVCWADEYPTTTDGQWIDITGLPAGDYVLEVEVNAERFFQEAEYANNSSAVLISIPAP